MPVPDWSMIGMTITAGKLIGNHIIQSVQSVQYKCTECTVQMYRVYSTSMIGMTITAGKLIGKITL